MCMKLVTIFFYAVFVIFIAFSAILLYGFFNIVFFNWSPPEIYNYYLASVVGESIIMFFLYIKNVAGLRDGVKKVHKCDTNEKINEYMLDLVSKGTSLDIVSGKLSWVVSTPKIKQKLIERSKKGQVTIYLPKKNSVAKELENYGANIVEAPNMNVKKPFARFTLVNKAHPGSTLLAVGSGVLPNFVISEFDTTSNSQVVTLAQNYLEIL